MKKKIKKKNKTIAVVLAALFGVFGWLYTYKTDSWKFWLNLILCFGIKYWSFVALAWVIIDQVRRPREYFENYYEAVSG